ncbi:MAG: transcription antitermination factor NusB [Rhodoluna sp.]
MKKKTSRALALELLRKVNQEDAYANLALPKLLHQSDFDSRDRAFVQELGFGAIRWQLTYDAIIDLVSTRSVTKIDPLLLNCLRLGAHQILNMRVPPHAAFSETVELVRQECGEPLVGFANGVLRRVSEKDLATWISEIIANSPPTAKLAIEYSHPEWIVVALKQALAADNLEHTIEELLEANNTSAKVNLVALPGLTEVPKSEGTVSSNLFNPVGFSITMGNPDLLPRFKDGAIRVQDEGSQVAALALVDYKPAPADELWLDMCAGPGGKAALLAAKARSCGAKLVANEILPHRAKLVKQALEPFPEVELTHVDGREIGEKALDSYDRILLDAPCTGLGALRRRPEARWRKSNSDIKELSKLQFELLKSASYSLKQDGLLLYVTCSPHLSETTSIVNRAVKDLGLVVLDLTSFMNERYFKGTLPNNRKTVQLFTHRDGTDSMFMALMTKPSRQ